MYLLPFLVFERTTEGLGCRGHGLRDGPSVCASMECLTCGRALMSLQSVKGRMRCRRGLSLGRGAEGETNEKIRRRRRKGNARKRDRHSLRRMNGRSISIHFTDIFAISTSWVQQLS